MLLKQRASPNVGAVSDVARSYLFACICFVSKLYILLRTVMYAAFWTRLIWICGVYTAYLNMYFSLNDITFLVNGWGKLVSVYHEMFHTKKPTCFYPNNNVSDEVKWAEPLMNCVPSPSGLSAEAEVLLAACAGPSVCINLLWGHSTVESLLQAAEKKHHLHGWALLME